MGTASYTLPDGRKARITFESQEQLNSAIADLDARFAQTPRQQYEQKFASVDPSERPPMLPEEMTAAERLPSQSSPLRGVKDYFGGVGQALSAGARAPRIPGPLGVDPGTVETAGALLSGAVAAPLGSLMGMGTEAARGLWLTDAKGEDIAERDRKSVV